MRDRHDEWQDKVSYFVCQILGVVGTTIFAMFLLSASAFAQDTKIVTRKNIDNLTSSELAAFEHALQILKDRSEKNPYDKSGYLWQAWVHNCPSTWVPKDGLPDDREQCDYWMGGSDAPVSNDGREYERLFPGMCEHGKDLFLPWHRAQLYYFEKLLQEADPNATVTDSRGKKGPSTKDVGLPFWNWTRPPSGGRYPKAMEDKNSLLYHEKRNHDPLAQGEAPYTSPRHISYMIHELDWPSFGGYEKGREGGYGRFERESHNPMHGRYFGGRDSDMFYPQRAALDPGFFLFHAYIDLLFHQWAERHNTEMLTSQDVYLRADQPSNLALPTGAVPATLDPGMGQVRRYLDIRSLDYEYEVSPDDEPLNQDTAVQFFREEPVRRTAFGIAQTSLTSRLLEGGSFGRISSPDFVTTIKFKIPDTEPDRVYRANFKRSPTAPDVSYQMDVYIYPSHVPFDSAGNTFSSKYLAGIGSYWGTGTTDAHHRRPGNSNNTFSIDVTNAVTDLASPNKADQGGEIWNVSIAITVLPVGQVRQTFGEASFGPADL